MKQFLNFSEISQIPFLKLLNHLNLSYEETEKEYRGEGFIISKQKNLYFNPVGEDKGSVINFLAKIKGTDLRSAAGELKALFLDQPKEKEERKLPEYELHYDKWLEDQNINEEEAKFWEIGLVKSRGIMAGKVALKIRSSNGEKVGYIGRNIKADSKNEWFFFKDWKQEHLYNLHRIKDDDFVIVLSNPFDVIGFYKAGHPNVVGLMSQNMTDSQREFLKRFNQILVINPAAHAIARRLCDTSYVKIVETDKPLEVESGKLEKFL